jgi:hypothetical protein
VRCVAWGWILGLLGCASTLDAGNVYRELGNHEIATLYFAGQVRESPDDTDARVRLRVSVEDALAALDADYTAAAAAGRHRDALALATREAELLSFLRARRLFVRDAPGARSELAMAHRRAASQALADVDAAEARGDPALRRTELLRIALAFAPQSGELAARYARARGQLARNLESTTACEPAFARTCSEFEAALLAEVTRKRRELVRIATASSQSRDTALEIRLAVSTQDTDWRVVDSGEVATTVPRYDRFRRPVLDDNGDELSTRVTARYRVFERMTRADVNVEVAVRDLRPPGELLVRVDTLREASDSRRYISWRGDERALGTLLLHGTDRSDPAPPEELVGHAVRELAREVAFEMLTPLERIPR